MCDNYLVIMVADADIHMYVYFSISVGEASAKSGKPPKVKHRGDTSLKVSIGRKQLSDSKCSQQTSAMTVQVPRSKLRGTLGHSHHHLSHDTPLLDCSAGYGGSSLKLTGNENLTVPPSHGNMNAHDCHHHNAGFALDERVDQVVPHEIPHKSKYMYGQLRKLMRINDILICSSQEKEKTF